MNLEFVLPILKDSKTWIAIFTLAGGGLGWFLKSKIEAKNRAAEVLRNERASIYVDILTPFAQLFTDLSKENQEAALKQAKSLENRKRTFQLVLIGSDDVVRSWNKMWRAVFTGGSPKELLLTFGEALLAIRKGIGNKKTSLDSRDMLRWLITDIDKL